MLVQHMFHFSLQFTQITGAGTMRSKFFAILIVCLALPGWSAALADPGTLAERVSRASAVDDGFGAVVISIRSELYLEDTLNVYFLREGGSTANDADVIRFERDQGFFALTNDADEYKIRAFQLRPGTYRLVAHGINCPKIPAENERCLVDMSGLLGSDEISRPSRGYNAIAPTFEVQAGSVTYAGDFGLTARNSVEWSEIPQDELERMRRRFARMPSAPEPIIPGEYRLKFPLNARSYTDDANRRY